MAPDTSNEALRYSAITSLATTSTAGVDINLKSSDITACTAYSTSISPVRYPYSYLTDCSGSSDVGIICNKISANILPDFAVHKKADGKIHVYKKYEPKRIVFNPPATIVFWNDGTKTVVKCQEDQPFVPYYGFLAALGKKIFETNSELNRIVNKWSKPKEEPEKKTEQPSRDVKGKFISKKKPENNKKEQKKK